MSPSFYLESQAQDVKEWNGRLSRLQGRLYGIMLKIRGGKLCAASIRLHRRYPRQYLSKHM